MRQGWIISLLLTVRRGFRGGPLCFWCVVVGGGSGGGGVLGGVWWWAGVGFA
jgi:hypothetical protein